MGEAGSADDDLIIERLSDVGGGLSRLDPVNFAELLRQRGRRIQGYGEGVGLDRAGALAAVLALRASGIAVTRCDILKIAFDTPEYVCETRHFDRTIGEDPTLYCRRSVQMLEDHVRGFSDPGDGSILYVIRIAGEVTGQPD